MSQQQSPLPPKIVTPDRLDLSTVDGLVALYTGEGFPDSLDTPLSLFIRDSSVVEVRQFPNYRLYRQTGVDLTKVQIRNTLPWTMYAQIVGLFKKVNDTMNHAEALVYVWHKDGHMRFTVPDQEVSSGRAEPLDRVMTPPDETGGWMLWGHIHSHNTMGAFFSGTDDASEQQEGIIYGVVGHIEKSVPESKWRIRTNTKWIELSFDNLVVLPERTFPEPRAEWLEPIKKPAYSNRGRQPYQLPESTNHGPLGQRANVHHIDSGFRRVILKTGEIMLLWMNDKKLTVTGKRVEDLKRNERETALLEGRDWFPKNTASLT